MSAPTTVAERLDAIDAQLEILSGVFERLLDMRIDLERGMTAITSARSQIDTVRRELARSV